MTVNGHGGYIRVRRYLPVEVRLEGVNGVSRRVDLRGLDIRYDSGRDSGGGGVERLDLGSECTVVGYVRYPGREAYGTHDEVRGGRWLLRWSDGTERAGAVCGGLGDLYGSMVYGMEVSEDDGCEAV